MKPSQCVHFDKATQLAAKQFLKPSLPTGWLCIQDGCMKRNCSRQELVKISANVELAHFIYMNTDTLEIFCMECQIEITDTEFPEAYLLRQQLLESDPEQDKVLFGANSEYPQAFWKEKAGFAGTVSKQINSYVSSTLQLLAHLPPLNSIAQQADPNLIKSAVLKLFFEAIAHIDSGRFRVVDIKRLQAAIVQSSQEFQSYSKRTPAALQYQFLRLLSSEFQYEGPICSPKTILPTVSYDLFNPVPEERVYYSPMKALFSGEFNWSAICSQCKVVSQKLSNFQCIQLVGHERDGKLDLMRLIEQTFEQSEERSPFAQKACTECKNSQSTMVLQKTKCQVRFPNILLLQFQTNTMEGHQVKLPDQLDLSHLSGEEKTIFDYVGSVGKNKRNSFTHIRMKGRDYVFDNAIIREEPKKPVVVQIAAYRLSPLLRNKELSKNINSSIKVNINCHVPLPDFWHLYVAELRNVPALVSPFICPHGELKPSVISKSIEKSLIPPEIYEYLLEEFGGAGIKITGPDQWCKKCTQRLELIEKVKSSQKEMASFADGLSNKNKKYKVCIDKKWLQTWKQYLYDRCDDPYNNNGFKRPGPISNKRGILEDGSIDYEMYKKVSPEVWYFMRKFYGGGPLIAKEVAAASLVVVQAVDLRFETLQESLEMIRIVNKY